MKKVNCGKILLTVAAISCVLGLCGCGVLSSIDKGLREHKIKADDEYWTKRNIPPVELEMEVLFAGKKENIDHDIRVSKCVYFFLEEGNKDMLKKMFAKSVINNDDELDSELDELIEFYKDFKINEFEIESNSRYRSHKVDPLVDIVEYTYHTNFINNGERYVLDILFVDDSIPDEELLGVHGIRIRNRETGKDVTVNTINNDI